MIALPSLARPLRSTLVLAAAIALGLAPAACSHKSKDDAVDIKGSKDGKADAKDKGDKAGKDGGAGNAGMADVDAADKGDGGAPDAGMTPQQKMQALGPLRVGASAVPHAELINAVIPELKAQGCEVVVQVFEDYSLPNTAVVRGDLDANFFQTEPYLWRWRAAHGGDLGVAGRIEVEPMGVWSKTLTNLSLVKDGARVALPSDPANLGRALYLLRKGDLIDLDARKGLDALLTDVTSNPHKLRFHLETADKVARFYGSDELVVVNGNYALEAKLPIGKALLHEDETSPFPNVVVALEQKISDPRIVALVAALRGPTARKLIADRYDGAVLAVP